MLAVSHSTPADPTTRARLVAAGAEVFEIDVRLVDGRLIASHYLPVLLGWEGIQRHNARLRLGPPFARDLDLADVVELIPSHCGVLLDCKDDGPARGPRLTAAVSSWLQGREDAPRFAASSKNWAALSVLADVGVATWQSIGDRTTLRQVVGAPPPASAVTVRHTLLSADVVSLLRRSFDRVIAWTVASPQRARVLADLGVTGVTSDNPAALAAVRDR